MSSSFSFAPSYSALFATILALTFVVVGEVLSQSDIYRRRPASILRSRRRIAASMAHCNIPDQLFHFVINLLEEVVFCRGSSATMPSVAFFYVAVDALAFLVAPDDSVCTDESAFSIWIDAYMNQDGGRYLYPSHELYTARCDLLCNLNGCAEKGGPPTSCSIYYASRGSHVVGQESPPRVRIISVPVLLQDFEFAIRRFVEALQSNAPLMAHAASRVTLLRGIRSFTDLSE